MSDQISYSHFEISDRAEATHAKGESVEPTSSFQVTTIAVVYSGFGVKDFPPEEGLISQVGAVLEGIDSTDAQDAYYTIHASNAPSVMRVGNPGLIASPIKRPSPPPRKWLFRIY